MPKNAASVVHVDRIGIRHVDLDRAERVEGAVVLEKGKKKGRSGRPEK
ncbi:hypothetical protein [Bradyrhizobium sp. USDA 376]